MTARSVSFFLAIVAGTATRAPGANQPEDPRGQAESVLARARAALGGADKLASVSSLLVSATRDSVGGGVPGGELELSFATPDKYRKDETRRVGGVEVVTRTSVLNGSAATSRSGGTGGLTIKQTPVTAERAQRLAATLKREEARFQVAFLLRTDGLETEYVGEAEAPEGRADVLELCSGTEDCFRLFVDKQSGLPLMISYRAARAVVKHSDGRQAGRAKSDAKGGTRVEAQPSAEIDEMRLHLASYRPKGGILFPHEVSLAAEAGATEEWQEVRFELNRGFGPEHFRVPESSR